ncbi:multidrug permease ABC transporter [Bifidobacterium dolichotidis]|uniref:Multidrug permease ABC transporter n=1 Tax=Bifidobacterium dolichotidis TaxID=2306976 RepID=A0A430FS97_9BIFI|nr:ABC transporter permease [Bifidobacterium dolichotidis]RSX55754.1 multidrug permease ABC transporter [Bifidobacterium dolichotidis]
MHTYNTALRVMRSHKIYIIIYLVFLSIMMIGMCQQMASSYATKVGNTFTPDKPMVSVIDRDTTDQRWKHSLEQALGSMATIVEIQDTDESLQQAVASNYTDLLVIVPHGFTDQFLDAITNNTELPNVETVTSYTSATGALTTMDVNSFFTQTALAAQAQRDSDALVSAATAAPFNTAELNKAMKQAVDLMTSESAHPPIRVAQQTRTEQVSQDDAALLTFGMCVKFGLYPMMSACAVLSAVMMLAFSKREVRMRLYLGPHRQWTLTLQQWIACIVLGFICTAAYVLLSMGMILVNGMHIGSLFNAAAGHGVHFIGAILALAMFAIVGVSFGAMMAAFNMPETFCNGLANIFGLIIMFTSGVAIPLSMTPSYMIAIGKALPGWWTCAAIDNALGIDTATATHWSNYASSLALVTAFAVLFLCISLVAAHLRASKPSVAQASATQLAM